MSAGVNVGTKNAVAGSKAVVTLDGWGLSRGELSGLLECMAAKLPLIEWRLDEGDPCRTGLRILLVDVESLVGGAAGAVWNLYGPIQSMRDARDRAEQAIVLYRGRASRLPVTRQGCWVSAGTNAWKSALQILIRALAGAQWSASDGYSALSDWRVVSNLTHSNSLAVLGHGRGSDSCTDFQVLLRNALGASLMAPTHVFVAGVLAGVVKRTLIQAGLHEVEGLHCAPMTLDSTLRSDMLLCFEWPIND